MWIRADSTLPDLSVASILMKLDGVDDYFKRVRGFFSHVFQTNIVNTVEIMELKLTIGGGSVEPHLKYLRLITVNFGGGDLYFDSEDRLT